MGTVESCLIFFWLSWTSPLAVVAGWAPTVILLSLGSGTAGEGACICLKCRLSAGLP